MKFRTRAEEKVFWVVFWLSAVLIFLQQIATAGFVAALFGALLAALLAAALGVGVVRLIAWGRR